MNGANEMRAPEGVGVTPLTLPQRDRWGRALDGAEGSKISRLTPPKAGSVASTEPGSRRNPGPAAAFRRGVPYGVVDRLGYLRIVRTQAELDQVDHETTASRRRSGAS